MPNQAQHAEHKDKPSPQRGPAKPVRQGPVAPQPAGLALQRTIADPAGASPADILALQRMAGNRAVTRLIQAKLTVGPAGDRYEQEADRVAEQVMSGQQSAVSGQPGVQRQAEEEEEVQTKPLAASITPLVQRQAEEEEEVQTFPSPGGRGGRGEGEIQRRADGGFEASPDVESRLASHKGGGSPLPGEVRATMEPRFGADFGGVRIHTGGEADQLNRQLSAQAFTHGQDIYMSAGKYAPGTSGGNRLLAHELTHTIQQQAVPKVQSAGQPVQLKPAATIQRGITDWFKKKFGKGKQPTAPGGNVAVIRLKVDKANGGVGHTWISVYYDDQHSPPGQDQVDELSLLPFSKNKLMNEMRVPIGFWPLHTMRYASAEEESQKKQSYVAHLLRGKTPGGGRTMAPGHTGFSTNPLHARVPGRVEEPDKGHEVGVPDEMRAYPVTQAQLKNASNYIDSHREGTYSAYGIGGNNCTSFAINVLKAAGQSPPDASRLGFSTPDILAKNVGALNAKEKGPAVTAPEPVKVPLTETVALERLAAAGLAEEDIMKLRAHMSLQAIVSASLSPQTTMEELQRRFKDRDNLEALVMIMDIPEGEVQNQLDMLRP